MNGRMKRCRKGLHDLDDVAIISPSTGRRICGPCYHAARPQHARKYYAANRVELLRKDRERYAGADPEQRARRRDNNRLWAANHPEQARAWAQANPERRRDIKRNWQLAHPEAKQAWRAATPKLQREQGRRQNARRRARIARVLCTLTVQEWEAILAAAGHACIYCRSTERLSIDHLTPIARGGPHTAENVAPACLPCNMSKNAQTADEFLETA